MIRTLTPIFILIAFLAAWGAEGDTVQVDIVIRDFSAPANSLDERHAAGYAGYPGFQEFDYSKPRQNPAQTRECNADGATKGMVQTKLAYNCSKPEDIVGKPGDPDYIRYRYCAYPVPANPAPAKMCYGENLQTWYVDGPNAKSFIEQMTFIKNRNGLLEIDTTRYFPLDKYPSDQTWGKQNEGHNYGFTIAGSAQFTYVVGNDDNLSFRGDDDMWIFIDGELVVDLGGVHEKVDGSFRVDSIAQARGWADKSIHAFNFFYAERQTVESNLKLQFRLTDISESRYGEPYIKKAVTTVEGGETKTVIWVNQMLDLESLDKFKGQNQFPIVIRKYGASDKNVNGYRLESIEYKGVDTVGYYYVITGNVCADRNDIECKNLELSSGDSLSFNVRRDDLAGAGGYTNAGNVALPDTSWYVKSTSHIPSTKIKWAINETKMGTLPFIPVPGDNNPIKPPFNVDIWFTGNPTDAGCADCGVLPDINDKTLWPGKGTFPNIYQIWDPSANGGKGDMVPVDATNKTAHGFGQKGTPIPPQRAGELILTAYPTAGADVNINGTRVPYEQWSDPESKYQKLFGLPPKQIDENTPYGVANPTAQALDGGYQFVKNGFPGESSVGGRIQVAPTRCFVDDFDRDSEDPKPRINCLNFSLPAKQPFKLSVIIYDQLGNFVTQYSEIVTEKEFRSVVQGPNYVPEANAGTVKQTPQCQTPTTSNYGKPDVLTTNGWVKVNVNIYPFSKEGRRFGNGVYIAKIDRVDLPYEGCMNNKGSAVKTKETYKRYHADQKFGWMRTTQK